MTNSRELKGPVKKQVWAFSELGTRALPSLRRPGPDATPPGALGPLRHDDDGVGVVALDNVQDSIQLMKWA